MSRGQPQGKKQHIHDLGNVSSRLRRTIITTSREDARSSSRKLFSLDCSFWKVRVLLDKLSRGTDENAAVHEISARVQLNRTLISCGSYTDRHCHCHTRRQTDRGQLSARCQRACRR